MLTTSSRRHFCLITSSITNSLIFLHQSFICTVHLSFFQIVRNTIIQLTEMQLSSSSTLQRQLTMDVAQKKIVNQFTFISVNAPILLISHSLNHSFFHSLLRLRVSFSQLSLVHLFITSLFHSSIDLNKVKHNHVTYLVTIILLIFFTLFTFLSEQFKIFHSRLYKFEGK